MQDYFWSVCLEEGSIQAAIWTIKDGVAQVVASSNTGNWENDETLVSSADTCLSSCVQELPEDAQEPAKCVFGVPASWVTDGQIKREHLDKIRLLCNKLSLTPTGFVVLPEAIAHFKKSEEKTPISAVLIGIYPQNIDVSLFKLGNLAGSVNVARSLNLIDDVVEAFARFKSSDPFPSRFIVYDAHTQTLEDARQELIKADWQSFENIKILHTPQVEIFEVKEKMAAVSLAGAAEMGQNSGIGYAHDNETETKKSVEDDNLSQTSEMGEIEDLSDPASMGFSMNDISLPQEAPLETIPPVLIAGRGPKNLKLKLPKLNSSFFKQFRGRSSENKLFFGAVGILIILFVGFLLWWFTPKADVTIFIAPKKIEETQRLTYDTKARSVDANKKIVPVKEVEITQVVDKTKTATGTKTVGDPAKGSVTFYNSADEVSLAAGTTLTGSGVQFKLDSDITIASGSAASIATKDANITSAGVGAENNLASGTIFSVGGHTSSLQAKNGSDLSGGSSREVTAVSKEDIDELTKDLLSEATAKGKDALKQNLESGYLLLENTITATIDKKETSNDQGEEATNVKMTLSAKIKGQIILRDDINKLARELYGDRVENGFSMNDDQIDFVVNGKDTKFIINLLPTIDPTELAHQIAGKNINVAKQVVNKVPGFSDMEVVMHPDISFLPILPHVAKNISIILSAKAN